MESQVQQQEYTATPASDVTITSPGDIVKVPPAPQTDEQWQKVGSQVSVFLAELPNYIGTFFNQYKQQITVVVLFIAAIISVKVVLAVLDALNDLPLLAPTLELIGIGYSIWFVNRYLLAASKRQELAQEINNLKQQVIGSQEAS